ncbi:MAG: hypothetical protein K8S87_07765 [Planctomycetes bacterium]|nr:hypothetical protein [Planctomycetota bacterium]
MKSPNELLHELKEFVTNIEKDADKATRGMKAAGIRLRASMQQVRDLAIAIRKSVLDYRTISSNMQVNAETTEKENEAIEKIFEESFDENKIAKLEEIELITDEVAVETAASQETFEETTKEVENTSHWYSDFSY